MQSVFKAKRISEAGAQHLLMEMSVVKSILMRMPNMLPRAPDADNSSTSSAAAAAAAAMAGDDNSDDEGRDGLVVSRARLLCCHCQ